MVFLGMCRWGGRIAIVLVLTGGVDSGRLSAQCDFRPVFDIDLSTGRPYSNLDGVAVHRDVAVITANNKGTRGSVLVYRLRCPDWVLEQTLQPSFGESPTYGYSVAVGEEMILLGNPDISTVFVFRYRDGLWVEEQTLNKGTLQGRLNFGYSLSLDGDLAAIGAPGYSISSGPPLDQAVYVFRLTNDVLVEEATILPFALGSFALSVAVSGDRLAVGRVGYTVATYRLVDGEWVEGPTLQPNPRPDGGFGEVLDFDGDLLLVGAPAQSRDRTGSAYLYRFRSDGSVEERRVSPSVESSGFGFAVAIDQPNLIVTDPGYHSVPPRGRVVVFEEIGSTIAEAQVLVPEGDEFFGGEVSLSGETLLVGGVHSLGEATDPQFYSSRRCDLDPAPGSVNAAAGGPVDVLFLNGSTGGVSRTVEYDVLGPFKLVMALPPSMDPTEEAPFALYLWPGQLPEPLSFARLPYGIGCAVRPMPILGGEPQPTVVWNNAGRYRRLGRPTRPSVPAPSVVLDRPGGLRIARRFFLQGVIYDPGSAGLVPASVTNGISAVPVFR